MHLFFNASYILPLLFPDKQHSKLSPHGAHFGMSVLNNTSQTGTPPTDKNYLLTSIPHLSQLDKLKVRNTCIWYHKLYKLQQILHVYKTKGHLFHHQIYYPFRLPLHPRLNITELYNQRHQLLSIVKFIGGWTQYFNSNKCLIHSKRHYIQVAQPIILLLRSVLYIVF